jgi:hypothetical protein
MRTASLWSFWDALNSAVCPTAALLHQYSELNVMHHYSELNVMYEWDEFGLT